MEGAEWMEGLSLEVLEVDILWPRWVARIGVTRSTQATSLSLSLSQAWFLTADRQCTDGWRGVVVEASDDWRGRTRARDGLAVQPAAKSTSLILFNSFRDRLRPVHGARAQVRARTCTGVAIPKILFCVLVPVRASPVPS